MAVHEKVNQDYAPWDERRVRPGDVSSLGMGQTLLLISDVLSSLVFVLQCFHYIVSVHVVTMLPLLNVHVASQDMYGLVVNVGSHQFSEPLHALTCYQFHYLLFAGVSILR